MKIGTKKLFDTTFSFDFEPLPFFKYIFKYKFKTSYELLLVSFQPIKMDLQSNDIWFLRINFYKGSKILFW